MHHTSLVIEKHRGVVFTLAPFRVQTSKGHIAVNDTFAYKGKTYHIKEITSWSWNAKERELTVQLIAKQMTKGNTKKKWEVEETSHVYHLIQYGYKDKDLTEILFNDILSHRTRDSISKQASEVRKYVSHLNGQKIDTLPKGEALLVIQNAATWPASSRLALFKPTGSIKVWATRNRPSKKDKAAELFDKLDVKEIPINKEELERGLREKRQREAAQQSDQSEPQQAAEEQVVQPALEDQLSEKHQKLVEDIDRIVKKLPKGDAALMLLAKALRVKEFESVRIVTKIKF